MLDLQKDKNILSPLAKSVFGRLNVLFLFKTQDDILIKLTMLSLSLNAHPVPTPIHIQKKKREKGKKGKKEKENKFSYSMSCFWIENYRLP